MIRRTEFYSREVYSLIVAHIDELLVVAEGEAQEWERRATGWDGWNRSSAKRVLKDCRSDVRRLKMLKVEAKKIWVSRK
jgi:hypothetical protein